VRAAAPTGQPAEVADFSSRCIALHDGQLIYDGPADRAVIAGNLPAE
jgi:hypothetical protein